MEPRALIDALETANVLRAGPDDTLEPSPEFSEQVDRHQSTDDVSERVPDDVGTALRRHNLTAEWQAVASLTDLDEAATLRAVFVVTQMARPSPPTAGVPDGFVPVDGDLLDLVLPLHDRSLVYIWRRDCPPCDAMRNELGALFGDDEGASEMGRFAVFGPDWAAHLHAQYDVVGGPTTLFMLGSRVDTRLHGAQYRAVIETEVETLAARVE
jgi:hypothetical protein